ncbi:poly(ADP-ribose) glycohydrolase-like [Sitodiplosis mosellana]|uniref:poly(ADP-ribose) glycohydrolase-like n=1 Tax=Sitodiplosis mosellana TaxID=263140 RepID=UPI002445388D|nr:poly(ADP-ribose) glycohydrolase-like [Sitodiplosis mosellana]
MNSIIVKLFKVSNITSFAHKMSTDSFKGVPLAKIYRGPNEWHLNHLPPIENKRHHVVLYQLPIAKDSTTPPKPHIGEAKWDANHVKLACSPHNEYKTESSSDPTKVITSPRWEIIQTALLREIDSSRELQQQILTYNSKYAKEWKFDSLHALFELELDDAESEQFFRKTLPGIIGLALQLPHLVPSAIPLLKRGENKSISLSQQQIACLLANAFLCTFPRRNEKSRYSEYSSYPSINFSTLFDTPGDQNIEKIKCICNYFRRVCSKPPVGVVTFTRRSVCQLPQWDECSTTFADSMLHVSEDGTIEDDGDGLLQVDFANKFLGGGVLNYGCVQEEIRFMICPELLCSRLFTEVLDDNECLLIMGCEQFSKYSGYASTFTWTGDYLDRTPFDSSRRRKCTIVAIDAYPFKQRAAQYQEDMLRRELNKAYVGFKHDLSSPAPGIATGNWGCGAFNGDKHLKSLLQLMACCVTERPLVYFTFGDEQLRDELFTIYEFLKQNKVKISELWACLLEYGGQRRRSLHLYEFIMANHQDMKDRKPSTNGQCSKQANRSADKTTLKPKPISKLPSKSRLKQTKSDDDLATIDLDDIESKQYDIEDPDDDDQYSPDEAFEMSQKLEHRPRLTRSGLSLAEKASPNEKRSLGNRSVHDSPSDSRPAQTISKFFPKPPSNATEKSENQDKRPRSLLLEGLDADYSRKSPPKIKRISVTPTKTVISSKNTSIELKPELKSPTTLNDDMEVDEKSTTVSNDDSIYETADDESNYGEKEFKDVSVQRKNTSMSEDLFESDGEETKMDVSGHDVTESNVERKKNESKTPMKSIDRQPGIESYLIKHKRPKTSTFGNANKKTAYDSNESGSSKSPSDHPFSTFREESDSQSEAQEDSSKEPTEIEGEEALLTDDESDKDVQAETNHLKTLNVTSDETIIQIE